ncbi:hypothetical protein CDD82_843 [Ophiocordyceps australis]|uniref:DUF4604 domain-containing protein n=1 Tax=Ophiocordyceps australis TaxID=1399860 RepID=A0A2C5ZQ12_9HYPO|nr:hypothetical protein CDD82_843 [Ophiocordyceps australis]
MSQKITPKNLSYSSSLPPFLARLQAQAAGAQGPDALAAARRRSGKPRSESEEAEDAPLVVDEHGNRMSVRVDSNGIVVAHSASTTPPPPQQKDEHEAPAAAEIQHNLEPRHSENKLLIGQRKRKVAKIIGGDSDQPSPRELAVSDKDSKPRLSEKARTKKSKKIKLSFDEDQG